MNVENLLSVPAWQDYIAALHPEKMDLGLDRVKAVAMRLDVLQLDCPVITVAGTNGKGSTVAGLEAVYRAAGYKTGSFSSPYLFRLNEEIRLDSKEVSDAMLCAAFAKVEAARQEVTLTVFEFITLAALILFQKAELDVCILEVGLGGRLDAVNIIDADIAVVTSIAIDHADRLGNTRELIGREKAGIFRAQCPVVCGDIDPPMTLVEYAKTLDAPWFCRGHEFDFEKNENSFSFRYLKEYQTELPIPQLALENIATVLMVIHLMQDQLPVKRDAIKQALQTMHLPGRIQHLPGEITRVVDVSHNPAAAEFLANTVSKLVVKGVKRAVFSMLADKDMIGTVAMMKPWIDEWYIAELPVDRAANIQALQNALAENQIATIHSFPSIKLAYDTAMQVSTKDDCVIIFGSFYTVASVFSSLAFNYSYPTCRQIPS